MADKLTHVNDWF